jgi:hypothetical protein
MRPKSIGLIDATTRGVDPDLFERVANAINKQLTDLRRHWVVPPDVSVDVIPRGGKVPSGVWPVKLVDKLNNDEGGFHAGGPGGPYAKVAVTSDESWTIAASHEVLEMLVDPTGGRLQLSNAITLDDGTFRIDDKAKVAYLVEICDACESKKFSYEIDGIQVSDFVTPAFYTGDRLGERCSFRHNIDRPLTIRPGGYLTWLAASRHPRTMEVQQAIWLDPQGQPKIRAVGNISDTKAALREFVDARTFPVLRAAVGFPFSFKIVPGKEKRFECEVDHWVRYRDEHVGSEIERIILGPGESKHIKSEKIRSGWEPRPAPTRHVVRAKNGGNPILYGDKDLIDPSTVIG